MQSQPIKPLIVDLSRRYGGASTHALALASGLRDWGAAIAVLQDSPVAQAAVSQGLPAIPVGRSRLDPRIPLRIATAVHRQSFRLIDTQNIQSKLWGSIAAGLTGSTLVSTLNSAYPSEQGAGLKGRFYVLLDRLTNRGVARYIAVSDSIQLWLCHSGISLDQIDLIHNGVEITPPAAPGSPALLRERLGLPADSILCTAVGRLVWAKGYDDLIQAFRRVAALLPRVRILIVGDGPMRASLSDQIRQAGLTRQVLLLGYRERTEALAILEGSDLFLMPSRSEGIPYALLEAGALGLPILAARSGGIPEVVRDGVEAVLVEPGDIDALADSLRALCNDPQRAQLLGSNARQRIKRDFSLRGQIEATRQAYTRAVGGV